MLLKTENWASSKEAQQITGRSHETLRKWVKEGLIKVIKMGQQNFYRKKDLIKTAKAKNHSLKKWRERGL